MSSWDVTELNVCRSRRCRAFGTWIGWIVKTFDYINRVVITLPLTVYKGTWTTLSPLVAMPSPWSCVCVGKFLKLLRSPTVASEPGYCVDVICTSRTQVSCGRYKSHCLPACHTLVRRYCWMKRPGPILRVRLRETGSTDVLCTQVASGCLFLQL